jgi:hypothetical protein
MKRYVWISILTILIAILVAGCSAQSNTPAGPVGPGPQDIQPGNNNPGNPGPGNPESVGPGPENPGPVGPGPGVQPGGPQNGGPQQVSPPQGGGGGVAPTNNPGGGAGPVSTPTVKSGGGGGSGTAPTTAPTSQSGYVDIGIDFIDFPLQKGSTTIRDIRVRFTNYGTKKWLKSEDPSSSGDLEFACSRNWTVGGKISTSSYSGSVPRDKIDDPGEEYDATPWWIDWTGVTAITISCHITKGPTYDSVSWNDSKQSQWTNE